MSTDHEVDLFPPRATWDCVHPCAWLIEHYNLMADKLPEEVMEDVKHTLCAFGWMDNNGILDHVRAQREIARFRKVLQQESEQ